MQPWMLRVRCSALRCPWARSLPGRGRRTQRWCLARALNMGSVRMPTPQPRSSCTPRPVVQCHTACRPCRSRCLVTALLDLQCRPPQEPAAHTGLGAACPCLSPTTTSTGSPSRCEPQAMHINWAEPGACAALRYVMPATQPMGLHNISRQPLAPPLAESRNVPGACAAARRPRRWDRIRRPHENDDKKVLSIATRQQGACNGCSLARNSHRSTVLSTATGSPPLIQIVCLSSSIELNGEEPGVHATVTAGPVAQSWPHGGAKR